ncbi:hypothetical protein DPMN_149534 [Dreissena polymorpha]|uniref:Uncharacterized protein n=1 Tax=Dreissena polymorpha TaxID=45954 RepID=A0A9D4FG10_DREPO|nr:hypothetical protein DPMN_149534 [Dreissena polymorpha]
MTFRVLTRKTTPLPGDVIGTNNVTTKTTPPTGRHFFSTDRNHFRTQLRYHWDIFFLTRKISILPNITRIVKTAQPLAAIKGLEQFSNRAIIRTNWTINGTSRVKTAPPPGGHNI